MIAKATSLSGQLSRAILITVCSFWLAGSAAVGWYVDSEIAEGLDSSLVQSANRLLELAAHEMDEARSHADPMPAPPAAAAMVPAPAASLPAVSASQPAAASPLDHAHDGAPGTEIQGDYLMYQVVDDQGQLLMRSLDAPAQALAVPLRSGFAQTPDWRVYTLRHPVQALYIHVADPIAHRQQARYETLAFLLLPLLAILPVLAWLVRRTVASRMVAVDAVAGQIRQRSGNNLDAVNADGLPDELGSLVENVNRLLARLHDALQTERALSANAAHELRTPLTVAQLRLSNVLALDLSGPVRAEVGSASAALTQLKRRTEKLLQLSRAESGASLARAPLCLNDVVDAVLQEFEADDAAYRRLHVFDEGDVQVMGDFDAIAIALRNLIENGLRYGGTGEVGIHIEEPGVIRVRDAGPGVGPEQLRDLTQRHVRFAQHAAGFGLGLSIVKTIVERQGGQLQFSSPPPGQASGFEATVRLSPR